MDEYECVGGWVDTWFDEDTESKYYINWTKTPYVFNDDTKNLFLKGDIKYYCDDAIERVSRSKIKKLFDMIFSDMMTFVPIRSSAKTTIAHTPSGDVPSLVRTWKSGSGQTLQFWYADQIANMLCTEQGHAIIYESPKTFLIVGNFGSHPFVYTPEFGFVNSDGSTSGKCEFDSTPDSLIKAAQAKAVEYIFDQIH